MVQNLNTHSQNGLCKWERKLGSCDHSSGQQLEPVGRQIKYWILGTVKGGCIQREITAMAAQLSQATRRPGTSKIQSNLNNMTPVKSFSPRWSPYHLWHYGLCVGGWSAWPPAELAVQLHFLLDSLMPSLQHDGLDYLKKYTRSTTETYNFRFRRKSNINAKRYFFHRGADYLFLRRCMCVRSNFVFILFMLSDFHFICIPLSYFRYGAKLDKILRISYKG